MINPDNSKNINQQTIPVITFKGHDLSDIKIEIKKAALGIIFKNKLYKKEQISNLFKLFLKRNNHLQSSLFKDVFEEILIDLKKINNSQK